MRMNFLMLAVLTNLFACSPKSKEHTETMQTNKETRRLLVVKSEYQWAADLIAQSRDWETVTKNGVPVHVQYRDATLCRAPIPGVKDHGPHGAEISSFSFSADTNSDKTSKTRANQFIVNPTGRGHFYDYPGLFDEPQTKLPAQHTVGTIIVKEKYFDLKDANARENADSYGVMIKREPGYDPDHGNWEYAYIEVNKRNMITGATRGKLASCIDCHANRKHTDFVFRNYPLLTPPD